MASVSTTRTAALGSNGGGHGTFGFGHVAAFHGHSKSYMRKYLISV